MKNRILSFCFAIVVICGITAVSHAASAYSGDILIAVNTDFSTKNLVAGEFTAANEITASCVYSVADDVSVCAESEPMGVCGFEDILLEPAGEASTFTNFSAAATEYEVGSSVSIKDNNGSARPTQCLYIGEACTVWGSTADAAEIRITEEIAKQIADQFDAKIQDMVNAFGSWYDVDQDGKVAIFCYDINGEYASGSSGSSYVLGFFSGLDLFSADGKLNGIPFKDTTGNGNSKDCIHIDTYPTMGSKGNELSNAGNAFSTLFHEFQHLINMSHSIAGGTAASFVQMPTYLNEAFSMAAEHMLFGADSCVSRISYYNGSRYGQGNPLTYWSNNLSNYANSYLFGQYLRTRYKQKTEHDTGNSVYQAILAAIKSAPQNDVLDTTAALLETNAYDLITDFWAAVYLNQETGKYGFDGETWSQAINPKIHDLSNLGSYSTAVRNGSAVAFWLDESGFSPDAKKAMAFLTVDADGNVTKDSLITVTVGESEHGSIILPKNIVYGQDFMFTAVPHKGYKFDAFFKDGLLSAADFKVTEPFTASARFVASGLCGNSLAWSLSDEDNDSVKETMRITGSGAMYDFSIAEPAPWLEEVGITGVIIESGATTIGQNAFYEYAGLQSITVPASITKMGKDAFNGCTGLTAVRIADSDAWCSVIFEGNSYANPLTYAQTLTLNGAPVTDLVIPDGITKINFAAFFHCTSLQRVTVPSSVTTISQAAFAYCTNLQEISLPHGIQAIGNSAFIGCTKLEKAHYPGRQEHWNSVSVGTDNSTLTNALMFEETEIKESTTQTGTTFSIAQYAAETANAFVALYNEEGKMLLCKCMELPIDTTKSLTLTSAQISSAANCKVILLAQDENSNMIPFTTLYLKDLA